jgi:hypothetical protein
LLFCFSGSCVRSISVPAVPPTYSCCSNNNNNGNRISIISPRGGDIVVNISSQRRYNLLLHKRNVVIASTFVVLFPAVSYAIIDVSCKIVVTAFVVEFLLNYTSGTKNSGRKKYTLLW